MAAGRNSAAPGVLTALSWAAAIYLIALLSGYYLHLRDVRRHHLESASFVLIALLLAAVVSRKGEAGGETTAPPPVLGRFLALVFVVIGAALYLPVLSSGLFADDYVVLQAAGEGHLTVWTQLFRPTIFVVWRIANRLTSHTPPLLHAINIALHVLNGAMVTALAYRAGLSRLPGAAAGLLFLCFPAAVEAVAWPSGIQDVLMTSLVLGFLLAILHPAISTRRAIAAVALLLGALLTKETAVVAPVLAVLLCLAIPVERKVWIHVSIAASIVAVFLLVRFTLLPLPDDYLAPLSRYAAKEILVRPFASLGVPLREAETAGMPVLALTLSAVVVVMLCIGAARWSRHDRRFHLALACTMSVLVSIAPVHGFFSVTADLHGSRYLYLGSVGWAMLLAAVSQDGSSRARAVGGILLLVVLVSWSSFTLLHVNVWRDAATTRDRILKAAENASLNQCSAWAVYGLPDRVNGVPAFVNGFPEALRAAGRMERFHVAPQSLEPGECRLRWNGSDFVREP